MRNLVMAAALSATALIIACEDPPENIQARAENSAAALENSYKILEAEAENDIAALAAPIENEADSLLQNIVTVDNISEQPDPAAN